MNKKVLGYIGFFAVLFTVFLVVISKSFDFNKSTLAIINNNVAPFSFIDQNGKTRTEKDVEGKVYVAEYFFTTCRGICPKMNANMRRVWDAYKNESDFLILSHTCMPETDSVPLLKKYENWMVNGELTKRSDGVAVIVPPEDLKTITNNNWFFLTGDKPSLYKMARASYMIDNNKTDTAKDPVNDFIHTQFFALVDKQRRVRGIYDGLRNAEIEKLIEDIKGLLKERAEASGFKNGFSNTPN